MQSSYIAPLGHILLLIIQMTVKNKTYASFDNYRNWEGQTFAANAWILKATDSIFGA
jgi:hypothetical protein